MHLLLIDVNNLLCRAFFAGDKIYTDCNKPIGAVCALATYLQYLIKLLAPTHIAMARDLGSKTWRHRLYPEYKKNRSKADEELYAQFPMVPILAKYLDIPLFGHDNFEADDCIATLATQAQEFAQTTIVSTDKDLCQLVNDKVRIYNPHTRSIQEQSHIEQKYSLPVSQLINYLSLIGDSSDNLPGVPGIGPKSALVILQKCSNLMELDQHLDSLPQQISKKLMNQEKQIQLMQQMIKLTCDVEMEKPFCQENFEHFSWKTYKDVSVKALKELFSKTGT